MTSPDTREVEFEIDYFTAQGGRKMQEDSGFIFSIENAEGKTRAYFIAILDGHGGKEAVDQVMEMLPSCMPIFACALEKGAPSIEELLEMLCATLHSATAQFIAGTTFTCALIDQKLMRMYVANLGDSSLLHIRKGKVVTKTTTHNIRTNMSDRKIALEHGGRFEEGYLFSGEYGVQCTRALGDCRIPQLIREPEIISVKIKRGDTIVLLTDGVITTCNDERYSNEARAIARLLEDNPSISAEDITYQGMEIREAFDNATTILVRLR